MTKSKQRTPAAKSPSKPPPKATPKIQQSSLDSFLEENLDLTSKQKLLNSKASYLWDRGGVHRYRLDIWVNEDNGQLYPKTYIAQSFFLHYDASKKVLTDMTIKPKEKSLKQG